MAYKKGERYKKDAFQIFDGRVKIYRTTSQIYQVQIWINEENKYVRKSLKTADIETAKLRAEEIYIDCRSIVQSGQKIFSITSKELVEKFLSYMKKEVEIGNTSQGRYNNLRTYTNHYLDFVGRDASVKNIDRKKFRDYFSFRRKKKEDILATVVLNESSAIKQMYRFAVVEGYLNSVEAGLDFGKIKVKKDEATRTAYTIDEYKQLTATSKVWFREKGLSGEDKYYRKLINDFIVLMSNGGFRTGELRLLKWKDVKRIYNSGKQTFAEVEIRLENTKVRKSRTFEMRRGDVFERIRRYSNYTEKEDFVFSHFNVNKAITKTILYKYFKQLIERVKERHQGFDEGKSLYCLRHFWISIRILANQNVYDLAKVAGTSLKQIERHYDNVQSLVASKQMNRTQIYFDEHGQVLLDKEVIME